MPDYKFTFSLSGDIVIEAATEHEAWVQAAQLNPRTVITDDWTIKLNESFNVAPPLNQGPVEVDDWDIPEE